MSCIVCERGLWASLPVDRNTMGNRKKHNHAAMCRIIVRYFFFKSSV